MIRHALLVAVIAVGSTCGADDSATTKFNSIDELWAGFDPGELPFEVETIKSWDEEGIRLETIYFTGEVFDGEKVRVFGYLGHPQKVDGQVPGILHIHGGGQTANLDWARFWARRGYTCLSFDFCGDTNLPNLGPQYRREHFTRWGKVQANMMQVSGGRSMSPTPRHNPWYHWALVARRGLSLLEAQPEVDRERLGIFGISMGGTLTWIVAGVDSRVKVAVPIYGNGWESYTNYPPEPEPQVTEDNRLWRLLIAPETHAPRIKCPLLFMSATDDFHGKMDLGYRSLDLLASPIRRQVFTPNYDHHIEPAEARSLPLWMDVHLRGKLPVWPSSPAIEFADAVDGVPQLRVTQPGTARIVQADIFYSLSNNWPMSRFWRTAAPVRRDGEAFVAAAPFVAADDVLYAFANVTYESGIRQSARSIARPVADLVGMRPTLTRSTMIDDMETSTDWNWVPAYTDPNQGDTAFFEPWRGTGDERGFTLDRTMFPHNRPMSFYFGTRKIGDPQFRVQRVTAISIDCLTEALPEKLTVRLKHRLPGEYSQEYSAEILPGLADEAKGPEPQPADSRWRTIRMTREQFKNPQEIALPDWEHVEYFILQGQNPANHPPVFKRLRWE
ncbi:MAG TPA: dienelactone hydrolase family protein [Pirellulales bacterium]|jgi:dienelactone hydrolase